MCGHSGPTVVHGTSARHPTGEMLTDSAGTTIQTGRSERHRALRSAPGTPASTIPDLHQLTQALTVTSYKASLSPPSENDCFKVIKNCCLPDFYPGSQWVCLGTLSADTGQQQQQGRDCGGSTAWIHTTAEFSQPS